MAGPARQYLLVLLLSNGLVPVCDPARLTLDEGIRVTRALMQIDPLLDTKLARASPAAPGRAPAASIRPSRSVRWSCCRRFPKRATFSPCWCN